MIRCLPLLTCAALALWAAPAPAQNAEEAADAAERVASQALGIEVVDPDSAVASDPASGSSDTPPPAIELPAPIEAAQAPAMPAPRIEMIAGEVVQPLPVAASAPASAPAPAPAPRRTARAARDPFVIKSILPIEGTIRYGDWFWDESAAPAKGTLVITVDLAARVVSAFRDGHEIGTAVALLGTQEHPTPIGTFPILSKEKDNVSEKYRNAPMPWTLRLTWNGIAIHGSPVMNGYASHGCIGVPDEFAARLFAAAKRGDKVIITRGKMIGVGDKVL